ncbi:hypothetical protein GJ699_23060 [Duganella sp. FT80W]|uniref:Uncharacterized protein n=1 Tax=Duganella guangzhouensis TaxID=2666084 RepID=A0A6I2L7P6_9BURK|nr:DUF6445 family protein [Duganella guangzhouensis]MRW92884.1 hypothetical protein [Duganella guangzhouensis]
MNNGILRAMFNPDCRIHLVPIAGQLPCIVIDDFLLDPDALVAYALQHRAGFAQASYHGFPGPELRMPDDFSAALDAFFMQHIRARLGARRTTRMYSRLSLVSVPPEQLRPLQRVCHHDNYASSPTQCFPAGLLYLFKNPQQGGTSFYRPRQSEAETHALFDRWAPLSSAEFSRVIQRESGYQTDSNAYFELLATVPAAYNRALFYDGGIFHNSHIAQPELLSADPAAGRLTLNAFWECRKAAHAT